MATLLDGVNEVFKRFSFISDDVLTTLVDSERQQLIDVCVQIWNEAVDQLFTLSEVPMPTETLETTITLVTGQREYDLPSDLEQIRWPLIDETDGQFIIEYPGGFERLRIDQPQPAQYTGLPIAGVISPINGKLRLDYIPTATENGNEYKLIYDKNFTLSSASDVFPFSDSVFDAMVPAVNELLQINQKRDADGVFRPNFARAARLLTKNQPRAHY